jgi:hypothetical protein
MTLDEIRQSPEGTKFSGMSDEDMADQIYQEHYLDMPRDEFDRKIGLKTKTTERPMLSEAVAGARKEAGTEIPAVMSEINEEGIASALGFPVDAMIRELASVARHYPVR